MASKSEAHEILPLLFARDGVPLACICDTAKEMIQGKLYQKLKDVSERMDKCSTDEHIDH